MQNWKDTPQYKRILEVLNDYWLSEPEELAVEVKLQFLKSNGESQEKLIKWVNPNYECIGTGGAKSLRLVPDNPLEMLKYGEPDMLRTIDYTQYRKKEG